MLLVTSLRIKALQNLYSNVMAKGNREEVAKHDYEDILNKVVNHTSSLTIP